MKEYTATVNKACRGCEVLNYINCNGQDQVNELAMEHGVPADFNYCVFKKTMKRLKLAVLKEILESD